MTQEDSKSLEQAESNADFHAFSVHLVIGFVTSDPALAEPFSDAVMERINEQVFVVSNLPMFDGKVMLVPADEGVPPTELKSRDEV